ncbi:MAG: hypothetical protein K8H88_21495 [Sandaracinaceae bacterium]|nr:hypothetical protein [Sandaracinaceae bacterium]
MSTHKFHSLLFAIVLVAGCETQVVGTERLSVNLQVTGAEQMRPMMQELERRGIVATVWLGSTELDAECAYVGELAGRGHEIAGKYPSELTADTTMAEQRAEMEGILAAATRCGAPAVRGFRATRFTANADTSPLLDELGYDYLERSARDEFLSVYTFKPYRETGHEHAILPMPIMVSSGDVGSMCDTSACSRMSAAELLQYERAAIDHHVRLGEPLILEWHPSLTNPSNPDGWWQTFLGVLDHLASHGDRIEYVTATSLVERHAP